MGILLCRSLCSLRWEQIDLTHGRTPAGINSEYLAGMRRNPHTWITGHFIGVLKHHFGRVLGAQNELCYQNQSPYDDAKYTYHVLGSERNKRYFSNLESLCLVVRNNKDQGAYRAECNPINTLDRQHQEPSFITWRAPTRAARKPWAPYYPMTLGKIDISCSRSRNAWGGLLENFQPFPAHRVDDRRGHGQHAERRGHLRRAADVIAFYYRQECLWLDPRPINAAIELLGNQIRADRVLN